MLTEQQQLRLPSGPVVDAAWLRERLDHPRVVVLDTRGRIPAPGAQPISMLDAFRSGHVPGARFVEWHSTFVDSDDGIPNQLAPPDAFARAATGLGIAPDTVVVAYDDHHAIFAARLWWAFRAMGHDRVRVLDGGFGAWCDAGHSLERGDGAASRGAATEPFSPSPRTGLRVDAAVVDAIVASRPADTVLVDARSRERYSGAATDPVRGHIPGAVNVPYAELTDAAGRLAPDDDLRSAFARAGIDADARPLRIITTCGSGISATVPLLALEHLHPGSTDDAAAVYDGSWREWSTTGRPTALGDAHG